MNLREGIYFGLSMNYVPTLSGVGGKELVGTVGVGDGDLQGRTSSCSARLAQGRAWHTGSAHLTATRRGVGLQKKKTKIGYREFNLQVSPLQENVWSSFVNMSLHESTPLSSVSDPDTFFADLGPDYFTIGVAIQVKKTHLFKGN